MMDANVEVLQRVCDHVALGATTRAAAILKRDYPFAPAKATDRKYGPAEALRLFRRDGFIDRYSGQQLVFPGVLRLLSHYLPDAFPYHPNWKTSATHPAYWQLYPTVDHVRPIARGGADAPDNWVTTSMLRNSAKANWTLEELDWTLHPPGDRSQWDGLEGWFLAQVDRNRELTMKNNGVRVWYRVARAT